VFTRSRHWYLPWARYSQSRPHTFLYYYFFGKR